MRPFYLWALAIAIVAALAFIPLQVLDYDAATLAFIAIALVATVTLVAFAIFARSLVPLAIACVYAASAWIVFGDFLGQRDRVRWLAVGSQYKAALLANAVPPRGELPHADWDGWGFLEDTYVYLVFDARDTLLAATHVTRPGDLAGIPCAPYSVRELEPHWYAVQFFTNERWNRCG